MFKFFLALKKLNVELVNGVLNFGFGYAHYENYGYGIFNVRLILASLVRTHCYNHIRLGAKRVNKYVRIRRAISGKVRNLEN